MQTLLAQTSRSRKRFNVGEQTRSEISVSLGETEQSILIREHGAVNGLDNNTNDPNGKSGNFYNVRVSTDKSDVKLKSCSVQQTSYKIKNLQRLSFFSLIRCEEPFDYKDFLWILR